MNPTGSKQTTPLLSNKQYDFIKYLAQILLPAVGALYFGLAQIWGLPNAEQVVGTFTTVDIFLGATLLLSSKQYDKSDAKYDGALVIDSSDPDKDLYSFEVGAPLDELSDKRTLTFKVQNPR